MKLLKKTLSLILFLTLFGCGINDKIQPEADLEQKINNTGIITFLSGEVTLYKNGTGETLEAVIGDVLVQNDSVRTGNDGFCEIQFEDAAVLRLEENTHLLLDVVSTKPDETDLHINMLSGTLMAKVNKMTRKENLSIRTKDTVCGVRGTQFLVSVEKDETLIAVKEGRVAVLPQALAVDSKMVKESPKLKPLAEIVESSAPVLNKDQQIRIKNSDFEEAEGVMTLIITEAETRKVPENESFDRLTDFLSNETERVLDMVETPKPVEQPVSRKMTTIDTMEFIPEISDPAIKENSDSQNEELSPGTLLLIKTEPEDAEVYLKTSLLGKGEISRIVIPGESYEFLIKKEGYLDSMKVFVPEKTEQQTLTVKLNLIPENPVTEEKQNLEQEEKKPEPVPEPKPPATARLSIEVSPENSRLTINGKVQNGPVFSGKFPVGEKVTIQAKADGYKPYKETLTVKAGGISRRFSLEEIPVEKPKSYTLQVQVSPSDAVVKFNGNRMGQGSVSKAVKSGETIEVSVAKRGYEEYRQNLVLSRDQNIDIELTPRPLEMEMPFSSNAVIRRIASDSGYFAAGDSRGKITVFTLDGKKLWEYQSKNSITENSAPLMKDGKLYFSGDKELLIMNTADGKVLQTLPLSSQNSHIFGKEVVPTTYGILFPSENAITLLDTDTREIIRSFPVNSELRMTPAVYKERLFIVDSSGTYHSWNITNGEKIAERKTPAHFPIAMAPVISGNRAYLSGRKGTLICMDLEKNSIIWEKNLNTSSLLFTDMQLDKSLHFAFAGSSIYAIDSETGELLYTLDNVSSPPLLKKDRMYFGTEDKKLIIANASSGEHMKELDVKAVITARPTYELGVLLLGTRTGKILFVIPEAIK